MVLDDSLSLSCIATGEPVQSFQPWPHPSEKGGGVVIPYAYKVYCRQDEVEKVVCKMKNILPVVKGGEAMKLAIV